MDARIRTVCRVCGEIEVTPRHVLLSGATYVVSCDRCGRVDNYPGNQRVIAMLEHIGCERVGVGSPVGPITESEIEAFVAKLGDMADG